MGAALRPAARRPHRRLVRRLSSNDNNPSGTSSNGPHMRASLRDIAPSRKVVTMAARAMTKTAGDAVCRNWNRDRTARGPRALPSAGEDDSLLRRAAEFSCAFLKGVPARECRTVPWLIDKTADQINGRALPINNVVAKLPYMEVTWYDVVGWSPENLKISKTSVCSTIHKKVPPWLSFVSIFAANTPAERTHPRPARPGTTGGNFFFSRSGRNDIPSTFVPDALSLSYLRSPPSALLAVAPISERTVEAYVLPRTTRGRRPPPAPSHCPDLRAHRRGVRPATHDLSKRVRPGAVVPGDAGGRDKFAEEFRDGSFRRAKFKITLGGTNFKLKASEFWFGWRLTGLLRWGAAVTVRPKGTERRREGEGRRAPYSHAEGRAP
ncbi:hypothetical protein K438DRAFT_1788423 [Mycena galopus ATCC 62051]|nr:hypothetical protein K438DRAFT_1788423 [Mycena galopus ATCC 62051]